MIHLLNCRGRLLEMEEPIIMGVINLTPDSFYEGSRIEKRNVKHVAEKILSEGATIIDLGPMSSRPGASIIPKEEELNRLLGPLRLLRKEFPKAFISVDTFRSDIARASLEEGADIINDIGGSILDPGMIKVITDYRCGYILMHMKGKPETMHINPEYEDVVLEIMRFFAERLRTLQEHKIYDVILDPGFGFGKAISHNFQLLKGLASFRIFERPIMAGLSRKSMVWKTLGEEPENALNGTTALHMLALQNGANILRVHDVKPAVQTVRLWKSYSKA